MSPPTQTRTYSFSVNNRSSYSSLITVMGDYLYGIKNFLVARLGYTVKYTCDGTTGPSSAADHTDRWTDATKARTRGANAASPQSFVVLTDGDGVDFMLTYQGATDDVARYSISQTGVFTPAGTSTNQPTATDESVAVSGTTLIEASTSADRVFHLMATSDKKNWRAFICRAGKATGVLLGLETYTSALVLPATQPINKIAIALVASSLGTTNLIQSPAVLGVARVTGSTLTTATLNPAIEAAGTLGYATLDGINATLQGSRGPLIRKIGAWSTTTNARGKLGNLIDFYHDAAQLQDGNTTTDRQWIHLGGSTANAAGVLWPWDGLSTPQFT